MSLSPTRRLPTGGPFSSPPSSPDTRYSTVAPRPTTRLPLEGEDDDDEDEEEETGLGFRQGGRGGGGDRHTRHVQVQALVEKRTLNLDYIRRVHDGEDGREGGREGRGEDGKGGVAMGGRRASIQRDREGQLQDCASD